MKQSSKSECNSKNTFYIEVVYHDNSKFSFNVESEEDASSMLTILTMITRGTLMASEAERATAYDSDGHILISYKK